MAYTRANLRAKVRERLGWPSTSSFASDSEINELLADSHMELWSLLSSAYGPDFSMEEMELTTVAGDATYSLVSLIGAGERIERLVRIECDSLPGNSIVPFRRGQFSTHVFDKSSRGWVSGRDVTYFFIYQGAGDTSAPLLIFDPAPQDVYEVHLWVQDREYFTDDTDTNSYGHDEYLILDVCAKLRIKEQDDASDLLAQKAAYEARLLRLATPIDVGAAPVIADVRSASGTSGSREEAWWWR